MYLFHISCSNSISSNRLFRYSLFLEKKRCEMNILLKFSHMYISTQLKPRERPMRSMPGIFLLEKRDTTSYLDVKEYMAYHSGTASRVQETESFQYRCAGINTLLKSNSTFQLCQNWYCREKSLNHMVVGISAILPDIVLGLIFFNEFEMLKISLTEVIHLLSKVIISESNVSHSGIPKPYYLYDCIEKNIVSSQCTRSMFTPFLKKMKILKFEDKTIVSNGLDGIDISWYREKDQRDFLLKGIESDEPDNTIFVTGDVDEILNSNTLKDLREKIAHGAVSYEQYPLHFHLDMYYYSFSNYVSNELWLQPGIMLLKHVRENGWKPSFLRDEGFRLSNVIKNNEDKMQKYTSRILKNGGWHISFSGSIKTIQNKLKHYAHQEYNRPEFSSEQSIEFAIKNKVDILKRKNMAIDAVDACALSALPAALRNTNIPNILPVNCVRQNPRV